ncbi:hypothetical protein SUGI_0023970 [Cryptomeria japonica]|nr:hypothetical protein SUGI_0023970 [Cryptomeria japonica]
MRFSRFYCYWLLLLLLQLSIDDYNHYDGLCERRSSTYHGQCYSTHDCLLACFEEHSVKAKCQFTEQGMACLCYARC